MAVPSYIHTGQDNLLKAEVNDLAYIFEDIGGRPADGPSPDPWDDAVGAEIVASVLDLDKAAGMEGVVGCFEAEKVFAVFQKAEGSSFVPLSSLTD